MDTSSLQLVPWAEDDFWLLLRKNEPAMTEHLGGPETGAKLRERHQRYLALSAREPHWPRSCPSPPSAPNGEGGSPESGDPPSDLLLL
ncbi:hypothetical protein [Streptomyces vinaceus]|uniref:hypothetical protein n=1 Tax=Streptomyces vinaceus TaxID=1960 RepID=UPI0036C80159